MLDSFYGAVGASTSASICGDAAWGRRKKERIGVLCCPEALAKVIWQVTLPNPMARTVIEHHSAFTAKDSKK